MTDRVVDTWIHTIRDLGPFRQSPIGDLYAYAQPERAEVGDPVGIYVPAEEHVRRYIARSFPDEWTPARRHHIMEFLKDESVSTFEQVDLPMIPALNGVLDLTDPEHPFLRPHSPHYGFTAQVPYSYDPEASAPRFDNFLHTVLPEDAVPLTYELIGYTLLPFQFLRKAILLTGPSGTGKSTLLYAIEHLVGTPNTSYVPLQALAADRFAVSDLFGKLANIGGDLDSTEIEATGMFKSLTGDDYIRADVKYGKPIRFRNGATCWFAANEPPPSRDHTDAWRERWVILPLEHRPQRPDYGLKAAITTDPEMQGVLRHALEHLLSLLKRGRLQVPESVQRAHVTFTQASDHVQRFLRHLQDAPGLRKRSEIWAQYRTGWAQEEGVRATVQKSVLFGRLNEAFGPPAKRGGELFYQVPPAEES